MEYDNDDEDDMQDTDTDAQYEQQQQLLLPAAYQPYLAASLQHGAQAPDEPHDFLQQQQQQYEQQQPQLSRIRARPEEVLFYESEVLAAACEGPLGDIEVRQYCSFLSSLVNALEAQLAAPAESSSDRTAARTSRSAAALAARQTVLKQERDTWKLLMEVLVARDDDEEYLDIVDAQPELYSRESTTLERSAEDAQVTLGLLLF